LSRQVNDVQKIRIGRMSVYTMTRLPAFAPRSGTPSLDTPPDVYADVTELFGATQLVYNEEVLRASAINSHLVKLMGDTHSSTSTPGAKPDGVVMSTMPDRPTAYRFFE
jgi:hypothetical protein